MFKLDDILSKPVRWRDWDQNASLLAFLSDLQANILKGHGRDHTANIFLGFGGMSRDQIAELLRRLSFLTTSALDQLRAAEAFKLTGVSGGRIVCVFLARGAYAKLGVDDGKVPGDAAFRAGMRARGKLPSLRFKGIPVDFPPLGDADPSQWDHGGPWSQANPEPDAMLLVADDSAEMVDASIFAVQRVLNGSGCRVLGIDKGLAQRRRQSSGGNPKGEGIEHFGYVDGRSQPLFLEEDLDAEPHARWSPRFAPSQFIQADPSHCTEVASGSYFVYRKLEQNVKRFKAQELELAGKFPGMDPERAGAMVIGRFEDGTPVGLLAEPAGGDPINDFNYDGDPNPAAARCPFKAHVRKTNPRSHDGEAERSRLMARRGITYGHRAKRPNGADFPEDDRPERDVGLLFMAYMADISEQFEFTQSAWANNPEFQHENTGVDPPIAQTRNRTSAHMMWHDASTKRDAEYDFAPCVSLKGGDYFFAPSISFLQRGP
ncbi:Dyp-type peroxidase [Sphingomonas sp. RHCKR7]|uniref:Dyp-type peroxidase n=1 Tax=Sphingomonas folli TaxID=2862497 RepID=UPI001CA5418A|nr:Dyp-type peroxidase [Sphingomonas folli]MBW6526578.1 Dyp-type peroxidase [Sphingomonas folli]